MWEMSLFKVQFIIFVETRTRQGWHPVALLFLMRIQSRQSMDCLLCYRIGGFAKTIPERTPLYLLPTTVLDVFGNLTKIGTFKYRSNTNSSKLRFTRKVAPVNFIRSYGDQVEICLIRFGINSATNRSENYRDLTQQTSFFNHDTSSQNHNHTSDHPP